jgi:hypothetical protein
MTSSAAAQISLATRIDHAVNGARKKSLIKIVLRDVLFAAKLPLKVSGEAVLV